MAGAFTSILLLAEKLAGDERLNRLLLQAERGALTAEGEKVLEAYLGEGFLQALLLGYANQVDAASLAPDLGEAVKKSASLSQAKAASLAPKVFNTLRQSPQFAELTQSFLTYGLAIEGHTKGQGVAAETHSLGWKRWIRYQTAKTGKRKHSALEGVTIPRDELFTLPNGTKVTGPHDWGRCPKPSEWINCGHGLIYLPSPN